MVFFEVSFMTQSAYQVQFGDNLSKIVSREVQKRGLDPSRASEYRKSVYEANRAQFGKTQNDLRAGVQLNLECLDTFGKKPEVAQIEPDNPDSFGHKPAASQPIESNDRFVSSSVHIEKGETLTSILKRELTKRGLDPSRALEFFKPVFNANREDFGRTTNELYAGGDLDLAVLDQAAAAAKDGKPVAETGVVQANKVDRESAKTDETETIKPEIPTRSQSHRKLDHIYNPQTGEYELNWEGAIEYINSIDNDREKIITWQSLLDAYNPQLGQRRNYAIVDKEAATITVYSPTGEPLKTLEIGTGQLTGDNYNAGAPVKRTPAGQFVIRKRYNPENDYDNNLFSLYQADRLTSPESNIAIHQVPNSLQYRNRLFNNGTVDDNRMSYGCVNLLKEDFLELDDYLGVGSDVYILPEENDNRLMLGRQEDGGLRFRQTKYKGYTT